ncbi:MAG: FKBP-type peptidyl-prolyl cis-trans isomerase [Chitinophagaceae bacterium]|nr:FKBP-type peptidyl-prolyl cis-trans isomerase [Chitinophagaceae bacterium]
MNKILIIISCLSFSITQAQTKKPITVKNVSIIKSPVSVFKNSTDSISYALALQGATFYKTQGIERVNTELIKKAFDDVYGNKTLLLTTEQANMTIQQKMQTFMANKLDMEKDAGKKFLAENKKHPGVVELPNGLQYQVLKAGTGEKPKATDTVSAHYIGTLITGKEFDNSYSRGQPLQIPVSGVIQGWVQALQMMPVGSKWKLFIPSDLAYGDRGAGNGLIPGGAALVFEIELLSIIKGPTK